ncbi:response regulator [Methyloglobulus morosus KoM1]|uniref:Response regulator n=1 Tax=Methyloglobulus morosus KoM1 TaxID=1116472 RepID=V5C3N6_9GAMM|nr:LuxR C-terminal-related transcriptional regulator [Methyloglobulus morosus]ESS71433.1 response regulator [Methyloglobulus morosus KoM1]
MGHNPKQSKAIAYLRQLCCSGLDKEIVIPEFLRAVQIAIPSGNNTFSGVDEELLPTYFLAEFVDAELDEFLLSVMGGFWTPERTLRAGKWFTKFSVLANPRVIDGAFYSTDLYNLVFRQWEQHHVLSAPVTQYGKPVGMLSLFRPPTQNSFNDYEQTLMTSLLPYVAHALCDQSKDIHYSDAGESGMMIMDTQGSIQYLSHEAKLLLALACHPTLNVGAHEQKVELMANLTKLCRNLQAIFHGKVAAPPSWSHVNGRGRFIFRAYWLDRQNQESGGVVGMTIEHQEPLEIKILRALQDLSLSPVQQQVAAMLAQSCSNEQICQRLHIKLPTTKDHIRKIFTKLDINSRDELLPMLLALDHSNQINKGSVRLESP